ncbi:hypothetical protein BHM03_00008658 [Ensete ventricosum]|nr:hypothetical protein BHM03_00008658 [Ensete ventricosum]
MDFATIDREGNARGQTAYRRWWPLEGKLPAEAAICGQAPYYGGAFMEAAPAGIAPTRRLPKCSGDASP